ncbi:MAG: serine hydrolase domain-containing protein [Chitinophagaceae bacterium]
MLSTLLLRLRLLPVLLLWSVALTAQVIQTGGAPNPHINYEQLAKLDQVVNEYIDKKWLNGAVALVIKDNQVVRYRGYGYLDAATQTPMDSNAIFRIMSQTKAIVSVGAMMLYEQGRFRLDQPIADFIPAFRNSTVLDRFNAADTTYTTVPASRALTFRDLLTHTSGIDYADIGSAPMRAIYAKARIPSGLGEFNATLLDRMNALAGLPLAHQPGARWTYGLNTDLLGCLVEVISGMNLEDYLRKNIFEPLGMSDTWFNLPKDRFSRLATVYREDSLHRILPWGHTFRNIDADYPMRTKHYFSGGAGLSSTAFDYAVFLQMLLNKGSYNGHRILAPATVDLMLQNQIGDLQLGVNKFGLGFEIITDKGAAAGTKRKGAFGWGGYLGTTYWADPETKLVCLFMTQQNPNSHGDIAKKFETIVYSALAK